MTNNGFCTEKIKTQQQQNKNEITYKLLSQPGTETRDNWHRSLMCYLLASETTINVCNVHVVKILNCFNVIHRNINKQNQICGPYVFDNVVFFL